MVGDVPAHWEIRRLKALARNVSEQTTDHPDGTCYIALEHVESWTGRIANEDAEAGEAQLKRFEFGDVLFGKLRPYLAKVVHAKSPGLCVGEFFVLRVRRGLSPRFLEHMLRSKPAINWINSSTFGARMPRTDWAFVGGMGFPLPPLPEQVAIARFLDHATNRIDLYIRAKEKLIALLEEQKRAIINDAVWGQFDIVTGKPYLAYKPTGLDCLSDVPAHWTILQLGRMGRFFKGGGGTKADEKEAGVPCIRYGDLYTQHQFFITSSRSYVSSELSAKTYTAIQYGDVLFAGSGETIGEIGKSAVNLVEAPVCCGGDVIVFRPSIGIDARFLGYATDCPAAIYQKACMGRGFTVMHIYSSELKQMTVALPYPSEQDRIARFLDEATTAVDAAIAGSRRQIELLLEYRTRIVADVVTGKVDVSEAEDLSDKKPVSEESGLEKARRNFGDKV